MYEYLNDNNFLIELQAERIKVNYLKIVIMSFDEKPIREIQGIATSGTLNINGNSSVRRTVNLVMYAEKQKNNLTNLDNLISLNKKFKVFVGYKNTLRNKYPQYEDIIWFPCGVFLVSAATLTYSSTGCSISITGQDKMALLNGVAGGTIPAMTTFHESYIIDEEENITVNYPTIYQIILEAVNHFGGESLNNIFINDLDQTAKKLVKYINSTPLRFNNNYSSFIISDSPNENYPIVFTDQQDIGYEETSFTYPGELIFEAGSTVTNVLDKICDILGNFEYFYDVYGHFIFQEIKNYLNNTYSLIDINNSYIKNFSDTSYRYNLENSNNIINYSYNPKYDNIKNDFIVWGTKNSDNKVRYHLVIDKKPLIDLANKFMWKKNDNNIIDYQFTETDFIELEGYEKIGNPCNEWREELYRQALIASKEGLRASYYDQELLAEWRNLFDTLNEDWYEINSQNKIGWNPIVTTDPSSVKYWLDFIDTGSSLGKYSVSKIGRRSKIVNDSFVGTVLNSIIPDIIFIENPENQTELEKIVAYYNSIGQKFCLLTTNQKQYFDISATGPSAFDKIRELLYQYLIYNSQVTISCIPCYYYDINNLIYIKNKECGIDGNFVIQTLSIPLTYNGLMTITASEALNRI